MCEPWDESELATLSADLDSQLEELYEQVGGALSEPTYAPPAQQAVAPTFPGTECPIPAVEPAGDYALPTAEPVSVTSLASVSRRDRLASLTPTPGRSGLTYSEWVECVNAYNRGVSVRAIAETVALSRVTIYNYLKLSDAEARIKLRG